MFSFYGYTSICIILTESVAKFFPELKRVDNISKYQQIRKDVHHLELHDIINSFKHDFMPRLVVIYWAIGISHLFEYIEDNTINCTQIFITLWVWNIWKKESYVKTFLLCWTNTISPTQCKCAVSLSQMPRFGGPVPSVKCTHQ